MSGDGFTFLFYTDVHIQPERRAPEGWRQAIAAVQATAPDAAFALCGGDVVLDANAVPYEQASRLYDLYQEPLTAWSLPVHHAFGNHDFFGLDPRSGANPGDPHWGRQMFLDRLDLTRTYYSFGHDGWHFIVLDTNDFPEDRTWRGGLDPAQFAWLEDDLGSANGAPTVLVAHIPLLTTFTLTDQGTTVPTPETMIVPTGRDVISLLRSHNVQAVLQGHTHIIEEIIYLGTRYVSGGSICGEWWKGPRLGLHPEGFLVCTAHADGHFTSRYVPTGWVTDRTSGG